MIILFQLKYLNLWLEERIVRVKIQVIFLKLQNKIKIQNNQLF